MSRFQKMLEMPPDWVPSSSGTTVDKDADQHVDPPSEHPPLAPAQTQPESQPNGYPIGMDGLRYATPSNADTHTRRRNRSKSAPTMIHETGGGVVTGSSISKEVQHAEQLQKRREREKIKIPGVKDMSICKETFRRRSSRIAKKFGYKVTLTRTGMTRAMSEVWDWKSLEPGAEQGSAYALFPVDLGARRAEYGIDQLVPISKAELEAHRFGRLRMPSHVFQRIKPTMDRIATTDWPPPYKRDNAECIELDMMQDQTRALAMASAFFVAQDDGEVHIGSSPVFVQYAMRGHNGHAAASITQ